jgi:adenylate kinase family enzyme
MSPQTIFFIGRSGSGKGTQVELLLKYLNEHDSGRKVFHIETGALIREFIKDPDNHSSQLASAIYGAGGLMPEFLTTWIWSSHFIREFSGAEHIVIDGTPRKRAEANILDSAFKFYNRKKPSPIYINVSREWSEDRLKARHRADDDSKEVKKRLDWFETEVTKTIDFYRGNPDYNFVEVNGEGTIEEVHKEIIEKLGL